MTKKTDPQRRKELLEQYRQRTPRAGVFAVLSPDGTRYYLHFAVDVEALMRRERFQLELGSHPHKALQQAWNETNGAGFDLRVQMEPEEKERTRDELLDELRLLTQLAEQELREQGKQPF